MTISSSTNRGYPIPGGSTADTRLADIQAVKTALIAIDADLANSQASAIQTTELGAPNGVATLDGSGLVPATQLPSYVDDVLEAANLAAFPATGEVGKIYVALDTNKTYRWSGSAYIYITSGAVDSVAGKTGVVSLVKADVGLGSVDNTTDATKPVSTAQASAIALKANIASPTFTGAPAAPSAATATNTTQLATTAFVHSAIAAGSPVTSVAGKTGVVVLSVDDITDAANENVLQNIKSAAYTCVLADNGKQIFHPSADTTARTWTIPSNAAVAYPIGANLTFINQHGAGVITIAINTDAMYLAGDGTTGSRTLAANGACTAIKVTANEWLISGTNLT